ncbi:MAG TPA: hypothetical protein DIC60_02265, partial [Lachnospiraceae bacterium]|nr:hypothetical protein [Lachnospiraceae bacterium]
MADWLQYSIILCLTDEIYNEINRNKDLEQRKQHREFADNFNILKCYYKDIENIVNELRVYYPNHNKRASDESDLRQLAKTAKTIVSEVPFFITRDSVLLNEAENIYDNFGISILRPVDLIIRVDELIHEHFYQPRRLAGSLFHINNTRSQIESELVTTFLSYVQSESKLEFQRLLRKYLSDPTSFQTLLLKDAEQKNVGIIVYG